MLRSLHLKGFKKHADLGIKLDPGLNYIVGPNYSGKSSILHGILFALGGVAAVPGGSEVAFGWHSKKTRVQLSWGNDEVIRTKSSGGTELFGPEGSVASGITAVNKRLTDMFGMPAKDLMKVIYAEQGSTASLVSEMGEGEVNRLIETISGVQDVDTYLKTISSLRAQVKGSLATLAAAPDQPSKERLESLVATTTEEYKIKGLELAQEKETLQKVSAEVDTLDAQYTEAVAAEAAVERVRTLRAKIEQLTEQKESVPWEAEISETDVSAAKAAAEDAQNSSVRLGEALRAYAVYANSITSAEEEVARHQAECLSDADLKTIRAVADQLKTEEKELATEVARVNKEDAGLRAELNTKRALLSDKACPTCGRAYEGSDEELDILQAEVDAVANKLEQLGVEKQEYSKEVASLREQLSAAERNVSSALAARQARESAVSRLNDLKKVPRETVTQEEYQASLAQAEKAKDHYHDIHTLYLAWIKCVDFHKHMDKNIADTQDALRGYEEELSRYGRVGDSEAVLHARQAAVKRHKQAYNQVNALGIEVSRLEQTIERYQQDLDRELRRLGQVAQLTNRDAGLGRLRTFLMDNRARFLEGIWSKVLTYASQVMSVTTGGILQELSRVDGSFRYREEGSDKFRPLAAASGSQKSIIGIGLKLALAKALPCGIDFILLDEATADMDAVHSAALMKYLEGCGMQVVSVTHNQEDLAVSANVIQLGG